MEITNEQWSRIEPLLPEHRKKVGGKGRPLRNDRDILNGILWVLRTGAPWKDIPNRYPPYQTCHRRFQFWTQTDTFNSILVTLARDLKERGKIDITECFIDGTFASAKKGGFLLEKQSEGRAPRSWQLQTALVFLSPLALPALRLMK